MSVRVELNIAAFNALRNSPAIVADLHRRAEQIAAAAGEGFEVEVASDASRGRVRVYAATPQARQAEAVNADLTRAIDAGRA